MKRIAKDHEIVTRFKLFPGYIKDFFSGDVFLVWGRYYVYREYSYERTYYHEDSYRYRSTSLRAAFVNREDAENYSRSRNENTLPC